MPSLRSTRPDPGWAAGRRVLVTGAARGIGAALVRRLHDRGARVALVGLEPDLLEAVARDCAAPWRSADVTDAGGLARAAEELVGELGGLDVLVANAGVAAQLPLVGGDADIMERTIAVNVLGTYHSVRAAGPHLAHDGGYALLVASLAAAIHVPLLGAYNASKAAVEALGNTLRIELRPSGARVGVAYFSVLDTDMTRRGFDTRAAGELDAAQVPGGLTPLSVGIDALERGIARRARRVVAPWWVGPVLPVRMALQPLVDRVAQRGLAGALAAAREEHAALTTPQPAPR